MIHQNVGRHVLQRVWSEAVRYTDRDHARIASSIHVDVRVADDYRFFRLDADFLQ